jgi:transcriptional regulator with XRE-family HTH domain
VLSETLATGLRQYRIGEKLRILRLRKKMGLVELGRHSGLSAAMLSKIERGRLVPTLPTLLRIALVFSVGLDHFFGDPARPLAFAVVRKKERQRFPERQGEAHPAYWFQSLDFPAVDRRMSAYFVEFEEVPADRIKRHHHDGAEMIYLLGGRLVLTINDAEHHLATGDSVYFDSSAPHSYRRDGLHSCTALVVVTP